MNIRMNTEVHFYEQEKASVFLESFSSPSDEKIGEIMLLVMFALRQMSNLGVGDTTDRMASMFLDMPVEISGLASGKTTGGLQLLPYPGTPGRKRFNAKLTMTPQRIQLGLTSHGFGWFATGVNYYAPVSILAVLRHLAIKRSEDRQFLKCLADALAMTGRTHLGRKITLSNHSALGASIIANTCDPTMS